LAEAFLAVGAMCGTPFADQLTVLLRAAEGMATVCVSVRGLVCMVDCAFSLSSIIIRGCQNHVCLFGCGKAT
jgi:hypothetical protein